MKINKALLLAAVTALGISATVQAAPTIYVYLTETPVNSPNNGVYTVNVYAKDAGVSSEGDGDGGISGFEFDISAGGLASPSHGSGSKANQVVTTWDSAITSNFSTIAAVYTADGSGHDAIGADFYDTSNFSDESLGASGYAHIASQTWTLTGSAAAPLSLNIVAPTSYDDNSATTNYQDPIVVTNATGVVLPALPEPASLSLLGLGALSLAARRRKA